MSAEFKRPQASLYLSLPPDAFFCQLFACETTAPFLSFPFLSFPLPQDVFSPVAGLLTQKTHSRALYVLPAELNELVNVQKDSLCQTEDPLNQQRRRIGLLAQSMILWHIQCEHMAPPVYD